MPNQKRTVRVAAVQMESQNAKVAANLDHALKFVDEAAGRGAKLIAFPEFMPTGYIHTEEIWDAGEPKVGPTVKWLKEQSRRLGVYIGTSFLEADGEDFFNTFVVTAPDGSEAGRVRKQTPAAFEAYFTKGDSSPHLIETAFGRLGIGICYECILAYTPKLFSLGDIDLILMPHCAPSPQQSFGISKADVEYWDTTLKDHARRYAAMFGVPAVLINHCGPMESPLPGLFVTQKSRFPGGSGIADSDGTLKAQLGAEEKVIVEDVTLDPARKTRVAPRTHGRWAMELPWKVNAFRFVEFCGEIWYSMSAERKRRAREISGG